MSADDPTPADQRLQSAFSGDLQRAADGDPEARQRLWAENYEMLHECAAQWFQRAWQQRDQDHRISLCAGDIVDEVYCRLVDRTAALEHGRKYFFRAFYNECLRVAVDHYRKTRNDKGRGKHGRVEMESRFLQDQRLDANLDLLAEIIDQLERNDARMGQIARLKVFDHRTDAERPGAVRGLTNDEIGEIVGIATRTVEKDWKFAKAFLLNRLSAET